MNNIQEIFEKIEENYNIIEIRDCNDGSPVFMALLNKKHSIEEFQDAINKAKKLHEEEIYNYGNDWEWIEEELDDFDYMITGFDDANYYVEY